MGRKRAALSWNVDADGEVAELRYIEVNGIADDLSARSNRDAGLSVERQRSIGARRNCGLLASKRNVGRSDGQRRVAESVR